MTSEPALRPARPLKVVVSGPPRAGVTTMISTISQVAVVSTRRRAADRASAPGRRSPVAMDFGRLAVDAGLVLNLFGTAGSPGESVVPLLEEGLLGRILLVDGTREAAATEAEPILEWFRRSPDVPYVVGVTKAWSGVDAAARGARERLAVADDVPVLPVDVRQADSARSLLLALLHGALARVEAAPAVAVPA